MVEAMWIMVQALLVSSSFPGTKHRVILMRLFGAHIGKGVVLKPAIKVKFPWRLRIGDHSWLGEGVWIDNLDWVKIGSHCSISQGAYLCTGSHDWHADKFDLVTRPIRVENRSWIGARASVAPGVTIGEGSVLTMGSVATHDLSAWTINQGNPAAEVKQRKQT